LVGIIERPSLTVCSNKFVAKARNVFRSENSLRTIHVFYREMSGTSALLLHALAVLRMKRQNRQWKDLRMFRNGRKSAAKGRDRGMARVGAGRPTASVELWPPRVPTRVDKSCKQPMGMGAAVVRAHHF
jgi:hypothetical protein